MTHEHTSAASSHVRRFFKSTKNWTVLRRPMEHVDLHDAAALEHLTLLEQVRIERMQRIDRTEEEANTSHLESTFANLLCCIPDRAG